MAPWICAHTEGSPRSKVRVRSTCQQRRLRVVEVRASTPLSWCIGASAWLKDSNAVCAVCPPHHGLAAGQPPNVTQTQALHLRAEGERHAAIESE